MTTLTSALQFAADSAHDMAGVKANRVGHRFVEQALLRLWREHPWSFYGSQRDYVLDAEETGSGVTLTEGASTALAGSAWASKYLTQFWRILFDGEGAKDFVLASVDGPGTTATFSTGQVWTQDSTAAATYRASRLRYDLPDDFVHQAEMLWHHELQMPVKSVTPVQFDKLRQTQPGYRSSQPQAYTIRGQDLWVWPSPGEGGYRPSLTLTYKRMVTVPAFGADGATVLDWPDAHMDLLRLAIEVEAARYQGKAAQIPMDTCWPEYQRALSSAKSIDNERTREDRAVGPGSSGRGGWPGRPIVPYLGVAPGGL